MTAFQNQRGQGTVEYILIIAIAVAIVLGGIYQLNSAARVFADNYFGDYLTCLLETGELPSLGGTEQGICNQEFKPFNLADGRSPLPPGSSRDSGGSPDDNGLQPEDAKAGAGRGAGNADGYASGGRFGAPGFARASTRTRVGGGGVGEEDESSSSGSMTSESAYREGYNNPRVTRFPVRYPSGISGRRGYLDDKEDKRTKVTTSGVERGQDLGRPRLIKVKPKSETLIPKEEEVNWSFGYMLRYLIIIIIIIALVVFFGGQALQVSKST